MNVQTAAEAEPGGIPIRRVIADYLELAKARLGALVVLTALVGCMLGSHGDPSLWILLWTVVGTALSSFGANILNQVWEVERDRRMVRTRERPLPAGRVNRRMATAAGVLTAAAGLATLAAGTNRLTAMLSLGVVLLYVFVYTPLKVHTPLNTVIGAVCGAVPPMMGWAAAAGRLEPGAWILGGILFVWQMPHFLALAWMYREDYARGGFRMLPAVDPEGRLTGRVAVLYAAALLPVTAALSVAGITGGIFLVLSQAAGIAFVVLGYLFLRARSEAAARRLFLASILYLPVVMGVMVADRGVYRLQGANAAIHLEVVATTAHTSTTDVTRPAGGASPAVLHR